MQILAVVLLQEHSPSQTLLKFPDRTPSPPMKKINPKGYKSVHAEFVGFVSTPKKWKFCVRIFICFLPVNKRIVELDCSVREGWWKTCTKSRFAISFFPYRAAFRLRGRKLTPTTFQCMLIPGIVLPARSTWNIRTVFLDGWIVEMLQYGCHHPASFRRTGLSDFRFAWLIGTDLFPVDSLRAESWIINTNYFSLDNDYLQTRFPQEGDRVRWGKSSRLVLFHVLLHCLTKL